MSTVLNNLQNGSRVSRLIVGKLPPKLVRVERYVRQYRRNLEDAVQSVHNEVDLVKAHVIDAAVQHMQHMAICRWLLREKLDSMSVQDVLSCSKAMADATVRRNQAVRELQLERNTQDILTALYADSPVDSRSPSDVTDEASDGPDDSRGILEDESN